MREKKKTYLWKNILFYFILYLFIELVAGMDDDCKTEIEIEDETRKRRRALFHHTVGSAG